MQPLDYSEQRLIHQREEDQFGKWKQLHEVQIVQFGEFKILTHLCMLNEISFSTILLQWGVNFR